MSEKILLIKNAQLVLPTHVTPSEGWVLVRNGLFAAMGEDTPPEADEIIDASGNYLFPGLIDLQINGGGGLNFNDCKNEKDVETILEANLSTGTTSLLATFITDVPEVLKTSLRLVAEAETTSGARVLGIHMEGPFFNPEKRAMHALEAVVPPSVQATEEILQAAKDKIKIMTLAPEMPGALDVTKFLRQHGVIASMSHSMATYEEAQQGMEAGVTMATHLFNTMPPIHHRNPGMITALLNSTLDLGVIADGEHMHESLLQLIFKIKGPNFFLVSDAIAPLGTTQDSFNYRGHRIRV
jgi:N-acetylglucosamine-6-phosphate deacetylase